MLPAFESETQLTRLKKSLSRLTPDVCPTSNLTAQIITSIQVTPVVVFVTAARPPIPVLSGACRDAKSTIGWLQDTHPPPHHGLSSQGRSPPMSPAVLHHTSTQCSLLFSHRVIPRTRVRKGLVTGSVLGRESRGGYSSLSTQDDRFM